MNINDRVRNKANGRNVYIYSLKEYYNEIYINNDGKERIVSILLINTSELYYLERKNAM